MQHKTIQQLCKSQSSQFACQSAPLDFNSDETGFAISIGCSSFAAQLPEPEFRFVHGPEQRLPNRVG